MTRHRATCEDCAWSYTDEDLLEVSDEAEDHARKEMHDIDLERAVATDGGNEAAAYMGEEVELRIRGSRAHVQALLAILTVSSRNLSGGMLEPAADLARSVPEQAISLEETADGLHSMVASEGDGWTDEDPSEALEVEFGSVVDDQDDRDVITDRGVEQSLGGTNRLQKIRWRAGNDSARISNLPILVSNNGCVRGTHHSETKKVLSNYHKGAYASFDQPSLSGRTGRSVDTDTGRGVSNSENSTRTEGGEKA